MHEALQAWFIFPPALVQELATVRVLHMLDAKCGASKWSRNLGRSRTHSEVSLGSVQSADTDAAADEQDAY